MESTIRDRKKYRSHTWRYFNEISFESVTCKMCGAVLKRTSGSTTSMLNHLERIHHLSLRHIKTQQELMDIARGMAPPRRKHDIKFKMAVINFGEQNSGEATARHFGIDPKRVREWRSQKVELQRLSEVNQKRARLQGGGRKKSLKYNKKESTVKVEKTLSKSTHEEDEEEELCPKREMSKDNENASLVALTEVGAPEQFEFQYGLEGPTFHPDNGEDSKRHLSIIKVEQLDPVVPEQTDTSCGSGSPDGSGPPGSSGSGSGSGSSPAAQFFAKCHQAGCTQFVFSEFASRLSVISERIASQQASEEDFNLTLKVLEASGMLPDIFAKRDQEMEKRLRELQKETESLRTARSAMRDACIMSFSSA